LDGLETDGMFSSPRPVVGSPLGLIASTIPVARRPKLGAVGAGPAGSSLTVGPGLAAGEAGLGRYPQRAAVPGVAAQRGGPPSVRAQRRGRHALLAHWLTWAARCRIPAFVKLARTIRTVYLPAIHAGLRLNASNAIAKSTNTKLRVLIRVAFGYRDTDALIAMAMLARGGICPRLPGRPAAA
jgi:hypothetical protein